MAEADCNERLWSGTKAAVAVKSDATEYTKVRGVYYGGSVAADIAMILADDTDAVTFANVQPGSVLPVCPKKIMSTNTTAAAGSVILLR